MGIDRPHVTFGFRPRFVNDMVILKRESGGLLPKAQGNRVEGKLTGFNGWLLYRLCAFRGDPVRDSDLIGSLIPI